MIPLLKKSSSKFVLKHAILSHVSRHVWLVQHACARRDSAYEPNGLCRHDCASPRHAATSRPTTTVLFNILSREHLGSLLCVIIPHGGKSRPFQTKGNHETQRKHTKKIAQYRGMSEEMALFRETLDNTRTSDCCLNKTTLCRCDSL